MKYPPLASPEIRTAYLKSRAYLPMEYAIFYIIFLWGMLFFILGDSPRVAAGFERIFLIKYD